MTRGGWGMRGVSVETRFAAKYRKNATTGCWDWTVSQFQSGYGMFGLDGKARGAHRVSYELYVGPIPEGLQIDHLCRNRACVNPSHLEPVTKYENMLRGINPAAANARKTHCKHGHPFDGDNGIVRNGRPGRMRRECRACMRAAQQRYVERKRSDRLDTYAKVKLGEAAA